MAKTSTKTETSRSDETQEKASDSCFRELARSLGRVDFDKVEFFISYMRFKTEIDLRIESFYNRYNLSPGRFQILLVLRCAENFSLSPSELAEKTGVSRATMTQFIDVLEKGGYVNRKAFPGDRRATLIEISPNGLKTLDKEILPVYFKRCAHFSKRCTKAEMKQLTNLYEKISLNIASWEDEGA